jgi:CHAT domain-containing protein
LNGAINLYRYIRYPQSSQNDTRKKEKILYIEARPQNSNLPKGNENPEFSEFSKAVEGKIEFDKLQPATFGNLIDYLKSNAVNIIHFDGHGTLARHCNQCDAMNQPYLEICSTLNCNNSLPLPLGYLEFESDDTLGELQYVSSANLSTLLSSFSIRLAVVSACRSGEARGELFGGIGPALILSGIPNVIAMQAEISMGSTKNFIKGFYTEYVASSGDLLEAIKSGRQRLMLDQEWFVPVLYRRCRE